MNKAVVTMPDLRFHVDFLNPEGELVAKYSFDHHQQNHMGHCIKYWLEHNELRPVDGTMAEALEFHPERLGKAFHVSKLHRVEDEED
jgi:hypothetical protein